MMLSKTKVTKGSFWLVENLEDRENSRSQSR